MCGVRHPPIVEKCFHSLGTVTPSAKAAFQGAVMKLYNLKFNINIYNKSKYPNNKTKIIEK